VRYYCVEGTGLAPGATCSDSTYAGECAGEQLWFDPCRDGICNEGRCVERCRDDTLCGADATCISIGNRAYDGLPRYGVCFADDRLGACDPAAQTGCAAAESCILLADVVDPTRGHGFCVPDEALTHPAFQEPATNGRECSLGINCGPRYGCVVPEGGPPNGRCRRLCATAADCPADAPTCQPYLDDVGGSALGACVP
jgi:hypothetical protein